MAGPLENLTSILVEQHPLLDASAFTCRFQQPIGQIPTPAEILDLLSGKRVPAFTVDDGVRQAVRRMLRSTGFKPAGRSKPASEYLARALADGRLSSINVAVDVCNAVSLHSGLPISLVDWDKLEPPLRIATAPPGSRYVFNLSGQEIDVGNLVCLYDSRGPCANAVKDSQRTKTSAETLRTLTIIWGSRELQGRAAEVAEWYRTLLAGLGAETLVAPLRQEEEPQ